MTTTTAQQIAALLDDDGRTYATRDGLTLSHLCLTNGATKSCATHDPGLRAYLFDDGSAIIDAHGVAWDLRHDECICGYCWAGAGRPRCDVAASFKARDLGDAALESYCRGEEIERRTGRYSDSIATEVLINKSTLRAGLVINGNAVWGDIARADGSTKITLDDGTDIDLDGHPVAPDPDEAALAKRDDAVRESLLKVLQRKEEEAREAREAATMLEAEVRKIREAARTERWTDLYGYLAPDVIESLCAVSPQGLLDEEG